MLTVDEMVELVLETVEPLPPVRVELAEAVDRVLAEAVHIDRDAPPWDRAMMDGYAVRSADFVGVGPWTLTVIETVPAGRMPTRTLGAGQAAKIMTGAAVPEGADAVVMVEKTRTVAVDLVKFFAPATPRQHIAPRGSDRVAGAIILAAGERVSPLSVGALAAAGAARPLVFPAPLVAVLATGDEIIPVERIPTGAQIRNSNAPTLAALVRGLGCPVKQLPSVGDQQPALMEAVRAGLSAEVLLLTGGVSVGDYDLVPRVLGELGVTVAAHRVAIKPGKPFLLGRGPAGQAVFGLPGNPVSAIICFELFVRPALRKMMGVKPARTKPIPAQLVGTVPATGDRQTYWPARVVTSVSPPVEPPLPSSAPLLPTVPSPAVLRVERLELAGSADVFALAGADVLIERPVGSPAESPGATVFVLALPSSRWPFGEVPVTETGRDRPEKRR